MGSMNELVMLDIVWSAGLGQCGPWGWGSYYKRPKRVVEYDERHMTWTGNAVAYYHTTRLLFVLHLDWCLASSFNARPTRSASTVCLSAFAPDANNVLLVSGNISLVSCLQDQQVQSCSPSIAVSHLPS